MQLQYCHHQLTVVSKAGCEAGGSQRRKMRLGKQKKCPAMGLYRLLAMQGNFGLSQYIRPTVKTNLLWNGLIEIHEGGKKNISKTDQLMSSGL